MSELLTGFGLLSTADDMLREVDLPGQRAIVTGRASGIGVETARALCKARASVTLTVRHPEATVPAEAELSVLAGGHVEVLPLDLARLDSGDELCRR